MRAGFTMVELLLIMGIFAILASLTSISFFGSLKVANLDQTYQVLIADLRQTQANAMSGLTSSSGTYLAGWGIKILPNSYIIFPGTSYVEGFSGNRIVTLTDDVSLSSTFASSQVVYESGSGDIQNYNNGANSITIQSGASLKTVNLNRYGAEL